MSQGLNNADSSEKKRKSAVSPTRDENFPEWYQQVIKAADLADLSPVRGCMVIKPWGYAIWELIQSRLDRMLKAMGHRNAYFPLFIPLSYFEKEAEHVEGFAKECAIVTHTRLEPDGRGGLKPTSPLEEPLIVRPTSETIIGETFSKWINSYRDLPLKINQWANVVRWEMRTRMFLRTTEFLWQEGHTVHSSSEEAQQEALDILLNCYKVLAEDYMAMPVICGEKPASEKFPGAVSTFTFEAMMQDGKALQAGTSHFLGQNFSKASNIKFVNEDGKEEFGWTTSWGVTTRLVGGLIMTHSDDDGLVLPPHLAPIQIVILPIFKEESRDRVMSFCKNIQIELSRRLFGGEVLRVEIDNREIRGGEKFWEWRKKGVPICVEIGARDIDSNSVSISRRDSDTREKESISLSEFLKLAPELLGKIQTKIFSSAKRKCAEKSTRINSKEELFSFFEAKNSGFAYSYWCENGHGEEIMKSKFGVTPRCFPFENSEHGDCIFSKKPNSKLVIWARSY